MNSVFFQPQLTGITGYVHGEQDILVRWAIGQRPAGLLVKVYTELGKTLLPGLAPAITPVDGDAVFLHWTEGQKTAISGYSSLWFEMHWDGVCQLAGPLKMSLSAGNSQVAGPVTVRTRTSGDVLFYADQVIAQALSIQADVTGKLGQINAVKQHVDQQSDHVDGQVTHVDEQTGHVDAQKALIDQAKQHIDGQVTHVDEQTGHVDAQKALIDQAKQHIDGQVTHVDEQTDHVDQQKALIDQAKQHIDGQTDHVDEQTGHVDAQKALIDQAKQHIDGQVTHVDEQTDHVDQQKTLIDQAKQHIDGQVTHVDDQTDHVDAQKTLIDQQKALIDQTAQQVAQNAQTATDQAGIAVANRFVFKGSYQNNTVYAAGDGVMYANSFIRRKTAGSSGSTFVPGDWDFLAMGINLRGTYQNNTYYALNDLVIFRRSAYLAPANMMTGATFNRASWVRIAAGWNPAGAWTAAAAVYEDDILTNQGSTYRVITDHTTPASFNTANLELIAAKGDPGTLTASAFADLTGFSATDKLVIQRSDNTLARLNLTGTGYPDVRPAVLADIANSRMLSPRFTFTRSGTATRVNAQGLIETVAANIPRIDYDPVTLKCLGLLMEESRTNNITDSDYIGGTVAASGGQPPTISNVSNILNPRGITMAQMRRVQFQVGTSVLRIQDGAGSAIGYFVSLYWRPYAGGTWKRIGKATGFSGGVGNYADFQSSDFESNMDILVCCGQREVGAFATSYIPTTTAAVTRNQETCYIEIPNVQGSAGGTLAAEWSVPVSILTGAVFVDGVVSLQTAASGWPNVLLGFDGPFVQATLRNSGVHISGNFSTNRLGGLINRAAMAWKINADTTGTITAAAANGVQASIPAGSTSLTMLGWSRMYLGYQGRNGSSPARIVHIRKVLLYSGQHPDTAVLALSQL